MSGEINKSVGELLEERSKASPKKPFLFAQSDGRQWTYSEFDRVVNRTANMLRSRGISKGDVVSLLLPNSPEYIIAYFACWKIGAIAGPVNSLLKPDEIEWVVENSEAKLLLVGSDWIAGIPACMSAKQENDVQRYIVVDQIDTVVEDFDDELDPVEIAKDDEAIIIYTSGTTGKPKGCLLTHGNLIANAQQITEWMGFGPEDRLLTVMPLFHMNAVSVTTMTALFAGGSTVVAPKFSASRFWEIIEKYRITSFGSVATMLSMLLSGQWSVVSGQPKNPKSKIQNPKSELLRFAMCGSAPVPAEVLKGFEETFGVLVIEGYGLSESTCRSTFNPPSEQRRPGSCGKPIGNEMKIFDDNDNEVATGELGEIVLRGPNIFKGYFKNDEATKIAFANGWFHTGDIGYCDDDGFFYIADRKSDMIIRGGENIYPREIDDLLYTHPAVAAAAVIGVRDELYGEEVAAFIVLKTGETVTEIEIIEFCKQHLADYKCPKTVYFVDDIPKGPTGKLLKRVLANRLADAGS
ncbi:MAG: class I adenylate-forming enzyme family protein [Pyrinomonadaceae bacterium]